MSTADVANIIILLLITQWVTSNHYVVSLDLYLDYINSGHILSTRDKNTIAHQPYIHTEQNTVCSFVHEESIPFL